MKFRIRILNFNFKIDSLIQNQTYFQMIKSSDIVNVRLYKLTNKDERHFGMQYGDGQITDNIPFSYESGPGGMHFFDETQLSLWDRYSFASYYIREVILLATSKVYKDKYSYKTDKFILKEREVFDPENLGKYVDFEDEDIQLASVKYNGHCIKFISNPSEKVKRAAVKQDGFALQHITNPSKKVKLYAIQQDGLSIKFIINPSEEFKLIAVRQFGFAIEDINNPSEKVKLEAVRQCGLSIYYIKNPSKEIIDSAIQQDGRSIRYVKNPSEEQQIAAIKQNCESIKVIRKPTAKAIKYASMRRNSYVNKLKGFLISK